MWIADGKKQNEKKKKNEIKRRRATQRGIKRNGSKIFSTVKIRMMFTGKLQGITRLIRLYKNFTHDHNETEYSSMA